MSSPTLRTPTLPVVIAIAALFGAGCTRFGAVYPSRPPATPGAPIAYPSPSRITAHITLTSGGLRDALDAAVPKGGSGSFTVMRLDRTYTWERTPLEISFGQGRIGFQTKITVRIELPVSRLETSIDVRVLSEPVLNSEYRLRLQGVDAKVTSTDRRVQIADAVGGVLDTIGEELKSKVREFAYDLRPPIDEAFARIAKPIEFSVGEARACAQLKVLGVEVGPTILADGLEKDLAIVVAPQITLPCDPPNEARVLPPLENVATIVPGPFTVSVPIAARYDELAKAMQLTFTDGKFFFSSEYPKLYLESPQLYASDGQLVLRVHIHGPVHKLGIDTDLDGDLFLSGHPTVIDNEVRIPDLEPTIETKNLLLSLKAMADGDKIRDQARSALRLDVAERLLAVRERLSNDLSFDQAGGCFRGDVDKIEITGVHPHATYLRVYVAVTARASLSAPCAFPSVRAVAAPATAGSAAPGDPQK